eukprot:TRINITY_DN34_c0_g1_i1.p1 TRINITY_DN34_c0_g1~~TRINITY_DN34_c0_g1_i1.p1  ORF type:complete len:540 (-),score=252.41 TRINITY_DN34_c0_g1_i1:88-1707(-)
MLVLFETPAGYALFKVLDEGKIAESKDLTKDFETLEKAQKIVSLKHFSKFSSTTDALEAATALVESKVSDSLQSMLKKQIVDKNVKGKLAVSDKLLAASIKETVGVRCTAGTGVQELMRGIRSQISNLIGGVDDKDMRAMALGLSHSLSRYKLKFSPDKVDTMIVQAIALLDDIDKELNIYAMRVREWYGYHFPELAKVVPDNVLYAKTVKLMGYRTNAPTTDFSSLLPEEIEEELKQSVKISMGTEVSEDDIENIVALCEQVIDMSQYREQLYEYLKNRMNAIAPNLTLMVGELVGARLIAHAGSLVKLAKQPSSTVQIFGAEKALFRALKVKHNTPKYGLIYHASLVGQASQKNKGKMARVVAGKASLACRTDAFGDGDETAVGEKGRAFAEERLRILDGGSIRAISGQAKTLKNQAKYDAGRDAKSPSLVRTASTYNTTEDGQMDVVKEGNGTADKKSKTSSTSKSVNGEVKKKKKRSSSSSSSSSSTDGEGEKKKKRKRSSSVEGEEKKKKRRRSDSDSGEKKKKKRSSSSSKAE